MKQNRVTAGRKRRWLLPLTREKLELVRVNLSYDLKFEKYVIKLTKIRLLSPFLMILSFSPKGLDEPLF